MYVCACTAADDGPIVVSSPKFLSVSGAVRGGGGGGGDRGATATTERVNAV